MISFGSVARTGVKTREGGEVGGSEDRVVDYPEIIYVNVGCGNLMGGGGGGNSSQG